MTYVDRLAELSDHGVSIWLDSLGRGRLRGGGLAALVRDRHVVGVTTNPTIFEQALADSAQFDSPVYNRTGGVDGRVSVEVDPSVAHDTAKTVAEAQALHWLIARPNVMIKIPAADAGLAAITAATAEGIASPRWHQLEARGATRQRPLWASTGVKNGAYPDTMYVTQLVAPDTLNTMPEATLDAVADHAQIGRTPFKAATRRLRLSLRRSPASTPTTRMS
jgi:transaldolase